MPRLFKTFFIAGFLSLSLLGLSACAPEVGSEDWCEEMKEKPKGDWTANEAGAFAKSCVF